MIGRVFDNRYQVIRRLGASGMAEVYLAHDSHLGRDVALKVLQARFAHDAQFVERFRREASSAAGLNHPNIVQIYDRGEAEGTYYIAMEYLEGHSLKDIIVQYGPLRAEHITAISIQILEALRFAHRRDVIHRDIKPQNIVVDDEGRVKVTDFGIARAGSYSSMTETGSILGTAHYLSPEQAQGGQAEATSDLYSLGVVMYEMATTKLPFTGDNPVAIAMQHVNEPPVVPCALNPDLPDDLEQIILRALAKQPAKRYLTAAAFLEDMRRFQRGEPVAPAAPFPPSTAFVDYTDESTRVLAGVGVAATRAYRVPTDPTQMRGAPPSAAGLGHDSDQDSDSTLAAGPPPRRTVWPWVMVIAFLLLLVIGIYVIVSTFSGGEEAVAVPDIVGMSTEQATEELSALGLELEIKGEERTDQYEPGQIARQDPSEGDKIAAGETVSVWLAVGEQQVDIPDLVGKTEVQALVALGQVGLEPDVRREPSEDQIEGTVFQQDPGPGGRLPVGASVAIWVSTGPAGNQVVLPNVVGMDQERAVALLGEELKLTVKLLEEASDKAAGIVARQFPAAGQQVTEGSTVTLYVSDGSQVPDAKVPDVVGLFKGPAGLKLGEAGFRVKIVEQSVEGYEPGKVIDQEPPGGTMLQIGKTVTIVVAVAPPTTVPPPTTTTTAPPTTTTTTSTSTTTATTG